MWGFPPVEKNVIDTLDTVSWLESATLFESSSQEKAGNGKVVGG
jgi:hypothetical protein